jgi:putative addiction module component (TIGR02574 family)
MAMDLEQTWAQVQALPIMDQQTIFENLLESLHGGVLEPEIDEELIAELERRIDADIADPSGRKDWEDVKREFWETRK